MGACAETGSCFFVADRLQFPSGADQMSIGIDIDGDITANGDLSGCGKRDFVHPDGTEGVDNAFTSIIPAFDEPGMSDTVGVELTRRIATGRQLLLFRLNGVDSTEESDVSGTLYYGTLDGAPSLTGGRLSPGQTFATMTPAPFTGQIEGGRIQMNLASLRFDVPVGEITISMVLNNVTIRARITASGLEDGEIVGQVGTAALAAAMEASGLDTMGIDFEPILQGQADLDADIDGICQAISVVIGFNAVDAIEG